MFVGEKDRNPLETIRLSTEYLQKRRIFFCEEWHKNGSALFSVTLSIPGTAFSVNGKGVSRELALASAHGELQERLLNKAFFRINTDTIYWMSDGKEKSHANLTSLFMKIGLSKEKAIELTSKCESSFGIIQKIEDDVFTSNTGDVIAIPSQITDYLYGTNGMCAGNSFEEACTQGLSEIIERYVAKKIFTESIDTPYFDYEQLEKVNYFRLLIDRLRRMGIEITIKDFSLGQNLPVLGVVFSNPKNHSYFLKMGAHPNLNIALERCFTEFAQGRTNKQLQELVSCDEILQEDQNRLMRYFVDGNTAFPMKLLQDRGTSKLKSICSSTNREYYEHLVESIEQLGYEIYVEDNSSEVFNAYRIIIPGMSEIADVEKAPIVNSMYVINKRIKSYYETPNITSEKIVEFTNAMAKCDGLDKEIGLNYPILSVKMNGRHMPKVKLSEVINLEYLIRGDIESSYNFLLTHNDLCKNDEIYRCLLLMEKMVIEENEEIMNKSAFIDSLTFLFDEKICNIAYMILAKPQEIFEVNCDIEDNYFFKNRKELYRKLYEQ